MHFFKGMT